tara:strand:- start:5029 stop:5508 length:480 start_codon:yes stop_codon:yes gene_type:complete
MKINYKNFKFFFLILFIPFVTSAQSGAAVVTSVDNVPSKTINSFEQAYPNATIKKWWLIDKNYQAEFVKNERIFKVLINPSGGMIEERKELFYPEELPEKVINGFKKTEYKYWEVQEAHVTKNTSEDLFYEIKVAKDGRFQIIYLKPNGEIDEKSLSTF